MSSLALSVDFAGFAAGRCDFPALRSAQTAAARDGWDQIEFAAWGWLGHGHFWTTPEEHGERQPLCDRRSGAVLAFDGRVDNRLELLRDLELPASISDARLLLELLARRGPTAAARVLGPFALVFLEPRARKVTLARDGLGGRPLFVRHEGSRLAAASEAAALLRTPCASLDEDSLSRYFALQPLRAGATFFADVKEVEPGTTLEIDATGSRSRSFFSFKPLDLRSLSEIEHVDLLRATLDDAVRCRVRGSARPTILMSGGLDSPAVAAAAAAARDAGECRAVRAISWIFDELKDSDESALIAQVTRALDLELTSIRADGLWPLRHEPAPGPSAPFDGPYRGLRREAYAAVSPERILLTGEYADELFADGETWLRDALGQRRFGRALSSAFAAWRHAGYRLRGSGLWSALRATPRRPRPRAVLEAIAASPIHYERHFSNGLEIRRPFRDLRLVQFAAGLAGDRRFRPGQPKPLLRAAQRGRLPAEVVERTWRGTLFPLVARGLMREGQRLRPFLMAPVSDLSKRLDLEPLLTRLEARPLHDGRDLALLWRALTYEIWTRRRLGLAGFGSASFEEETYAQAA